MAKSIETIKQDLANLEETTVNLAVELLSLYRKYLDLLKDSVQKQLILAGYQICTQTYPETFLSLSVSQRQSLQKRLREEGKKLASQLLLLTNPTPELSQNQAPQDLIPQSLSFQRDITTNLSSESPDKNFKEIIKGELPQETGSNENNNNPSPAIPRNPEALVEWYQNLEKSIYNLLENISKEANHILHESEILPLKIPTQVLDMAIEAHEAQEVVSGPPNILNLLVEIQNPESSEDGNLTKITAIRLKLSEIEFADPLLSSQRNQIHNLLPKLNILRKQYQNKQQESYIVEAEFAWRASWYEE
jgi:hypothetical protein